jgi:hypothetical protein
MSVRHAIWRVGARPEPLAPTTLASEQLLEDMIAASPEILSDEWMLIGRQEQTGHGGRIDLLAIAPDGALVLIEIKRDRTPRDVVAQAIDYASWVKNLRAEDIAGIYGRFAPRRQLEDDFRQRFGHPLDEDSLNKSHQIIIVAGSLDESSERIAAYLSERDVPINVLASRSLHTEPSSCSAVLGCLIRCRHKAALPQFRPNRRNLGTVSSMFHLAGTNPGPGPTP